jgi:hypothetical protein
MNVSPTVPPGEPPEEFDPAHPGLHAFSPDQLGELPPGMPGTNGPGCQGCHLEDDGDGESGTHLLVLISERCPVHGELLQEEEARTKGNRRG